MMSTSTIFSPVISRPSNKEQLRPLGSTKPAFTTRMGRGIWQPSDAAHGSPQLHKGSIVVGDFWTDTLFNPIWAPTSTRATASSANMAPTQSVYSSSPESLATTPDDDFTDSSFLSISSIDFDSPPRTAASTDAVLGSARLSGAFEDDYDRPEASPNFIRKLLRRSKSLRRQARMRDGDFRDSDDERDFSVASEWDPIVRPVAPVSVQHLPPSNALEQVDSETRSERVPSRLSRRVKVPSPINTSRTHGSIGTKSRRKEYEVEVGRVDGSEFTSSESGFDADDENDAFRGGMKMNAVSLTIAGANKGNTAALLSTPPKKSYAAIVATSPPRSNTPESKVIVPQAIQAARILEARRGDGTRGFQWRPFVEPFDI
uniref:Lon protease ) n=1 Tax=Ganoderma boninense TaxID=34458 RepID=A0A5K1K521_9APHY|nr:Lon protease (EC (ATP-dependent protease La) [Ganoderma boninense]